MWAVKMSLQTKIDNYITSLLKSKYHLYYIFLFSLIAVFLSRLLLLLFCTIINPGTSFIREMCSIWDNNWYFSIISNGYSIEPSGHAAGNAASWAFFPLDVILIKLVSLNGIIDYKITGFVLNNVIFIAAMVLSYKYIIMTRQNYVVAIIYILLMTFGPYCFYFSCLYTESLFLFLLICALICMQQEHYIRMGIFGMLLSACRVTGVFFVFVVLIFLLCKYFNNRKVTIIDYIKDILTNKSLIIGISIIPAGLFLYMLYLYKLTGDVLAFQHIQIAWRGGIGKGFVHNVAVSLLSLEFVDVYEVLVLFIVVLTFLFQVKHYPYECVMYIVPVVVQLTTSDSFITLARYSIGTGVFVISFVEMIKKHLSKQAQCSVYVFLLVLSWVLSASWFLYRQITQG